VAVPQLPTESVRVEVAKEPDGIVMLEGVYAKLLWERHDGRFTVDSVIVPV
jgi:hypothetical protein